MTKKADYTAEEWQLLLDVPALAGLGCDDGRQKGPPTPIRASAARSSSTWSPRNAWPPPLISTNLILAYLAEHVLGLPRSY